MAIRMSTDVVKLLQARGLLPAHCKQVELIIPPREPMVLRFEVFVADEHLRTLGEAFLQMAGPAGVE
jgi:hypothetical protein